ncbi:MAG TPA: LURP-one-related family protein [Streptosporangiaceae bacterium]
MRYAVQEKLFSVGDDFWITDEQGGKAFLVDGKVLRLRQTLEIQDPGGRVLVTVRKKLVTMHETMEIEQDGTLVGTVRKALVSPLHHRSVVDLADGSQLEAVGNVLDKEFEITAGNQVLARISRAWFRIRDTYGVDVAPGQDDVLFLAIAVALDRIHYDDEQRARQ